MHGGTRGIRNLARSPDTCCLFPLVACCLCREQQEARLRGLSELQGTAECLVSPPVILFLLDSLNVNHPVRNYLRNGRSVAYSLLSSAACCLCCEQQETRLRGPWVIQGTT
ncbi:hypothetical protein CDAR_397501 [Caerostris darwini]|uniref:Uncharacterized protein n=1 Tax=Caerostris darwini TaxID=1538125 RepID=A0AAV4T633_9ARAC|nr:hypothetical protein CDAR_397501 [Caerostris darwini]